MLGDKKQGDISCGFQYFNRRTKGQRGMLSTEGHK